MSFLYTPLEFGVRIANIQQVDETETPSDTIFQLLDEVRIAQLPALVPVLQTSGTVRQVARKTGYQPVSMEFQTSTFDPALLAAGEAPVTPETVPILYFIIGLAGPGGQDLDLTRKDSRLLYMTEGQLGVVPQQLSADGANRGGLTVTQRVKRFAIFLAAAHASDPENIDPTITTLFNEEAALVASNQNVLYYDVEGVEIHNGKKRDDTESPNIAHALGFGDGSRYGVSGS